MLRSTGNSKSTVSSNINPQFLFFSFLRTACYICQWGTGSDNPPFPYRLCYCYQRDYTLSHVMTQKIKVKIITFTPEAPLQATRGLWENVVFYDISEDVFACLLACLLAVRVCVCARGYVNLVCVCVDESICGGGFLNVSPNRHFGLDFKNLT